MLERLTAGARKMGLTLSAGQLDLFQLYYQELVEWNKRANLTAITGYEDVQVKHFLDSLTLVPVVLEMMSRTGSGLSLLDVGTGAGLPGLPVKIVLPETRLVLLDSVAKKTAFLKHLTQALALDNVEVVTERAEKIGHVPDYREMFDVVVSRAVTRLPTVLELTLPFCRRGGLAIAPKKGAAAVQEEVSQSAAAMDLLGGGLKEVREVNAAGLEERVLVIVEKVSPTPERFPRRTGVPAKRPL